MVLNYAEVDVDIATDKQIVRFRLHAVVVMQHKEVLLLIDSLVRWSLTGYARPPRGCIRQSALAVALFSLTRWRCPCTAAHYGGLGLLLVVSYSFIYLVPTDKLPFGLVFEEAVIVQLLLVYRLLLLGYVFFVCHQSIFNIHYSFSVP